MASLFQDDVPCDSHTLTIALSIFFFFLLRVGLAIVEIFVYILVIQGGKEGTIDKGERVLRSEMRRRRTHLKMEVIGNLSSFGKVLKTHLA